MADPYIGEIRAFGFNYAPLDWAFCNGQLLPISQFSVLFAIIGTIYGGDGQSNFALPNLLDRAPMHWGQGPGLTPRSIGDALGSPTVTLTTNNLPNHTHLFSSALPGAPSQTVAIPTPVAQVGVSNPGQLYTTTTTPAVAFSPRAIGASGGSQPHVNTQPVLTLNFCISLSGAYPPHN